MSIVCLIRKYLEKPIKFYENSRYLKFSGFYHILGETGDKSAFIVTRVDGRDKEIFGRGESSIKLSKRYFK